MILGTPGYMAPEQLYGEPADHRADIFSFGAIFYEMLSGMRVLPVDTVAAARRAMRQPSWPDLSSSASLSDRHAKIIRRCLEQQPKDRFQSVAAIASELGTRP
jgi:serine/threonine-protein kinase